MKLFLQCPSGISGDMFLAGLADLGVNFAEFTDLFNQAGLKIEMNFQKQRHKGLIGTRLLLDWPENQPFRTLKEINQVINSLPLKEEVRKQSLAAFKRLAKAESEVHGVDLKDVHFHEVGALDTLVDIVGAFWGLERLGIDEVHSAALPWFQGEVECAHGRLNLPAPAVLKLLQGKPVYPTKHNKELITPTGALLVDRLVDKFDHGPAGLIIGSGLGWGSMELETNQPNCLRLIKYKAATKEDEELVGVLECNVDHLTGEEIGSLFEPLLNAGALDALYLQGIMKKNRPGGLLQVLCPVENMNDLQDTLFKLTLTLGIRSRVELRKILSRKPSKMQTALGELEGKKVQLKGEKITKPEFRALEELSKKTGRSVVQLRYLLGEGKGQGWE